MAPDMEGVAYTNKNPGKTEARKKHKVKRAKLRSYCMLRGQIILKWRKPKDSKSVKRYVVYRSDSKKGKFKRIAVLRNRKFKDSKVRLRKYYYYKIRILKKKGGKVDFTGVKKQKSMKTVFIGDSTMESVPCYGVLPREMMLVKIGLNAGAFMTTSYSEFSINGRKATGIKKLLSKRPDRVFIMLGMNELYWISKRSTVSGIRRIVKAIKKHRKSAEVVVLAISPSGVHHVSDVPANSKIQGCNRLLKKMAKREKVKYHDWTKVFKNKNGYLTSKYGEGDGCHWKPSGARAFVKAISRYVTGL